MSTYAKGLSYKPYYPKHFGDLDQAPIFEKRAPTTTDYAEPGRRWIDTVNDNAYTLIRIQNNIAVWVCAAGGGINPESITVSPGDVTIVSGDLIVTAGIGTFGGALTGDSLVSGSTVASATTMSCGTDLDVTGTATLTAFTVAGIVSNTAAGLLESSAGAAGEILIGTSNTTAPVWANIAHDSNIDVTNASGTITLSLATDVTITGTLTIGTDLDLINSEADATGFDLGLYKRRGAAGSIISGDTIGLYSFYAWDGTGWVETSSIESDCSGAIATGQVGSNLLFFTNPISVAGPQLRAEINTIGNVRIYEPDSGIALQIDGGGAKIYGDSSLVNDVASSAGYNLGLYKNRAEAVIVTADDLGEISFYAFDGTNAIRGAYFKATSFGTIATNQIGTRLEVYTHPESTAAAVKRMTFGGAGNILVHAPDSGVALTVEGGGANIVGSLDATLDVTARTLFADGDEGTGVASTTAITNVVDTTLSSGDLSIKATSANPGNNAGFIKAYVGTQVVYIPYFTTIAP